MLRNTRWKPRIILYNQSIGMNIRWKISLLLCLAAALFLSGCHKKRPALPPPEAAPVQLPAPQPEPEVQPQPQPTPPEPTPAPPPEPAPKPKPTHKRKPPVSKPSTTTPATAPTPAPKPAPSNESVQISADLPPGTAQTQRRDTEALLQTAENNLKRVTRNLNDDEQTMMRQTRNYIAQSRSAMQDGDYQRAYNLALKAQLLSAELAK